MATKKVQSKPLQTKSPSSTEDKKPQTLTLSSVIKLLGILEQSADGIRGIVEGKDKEQPEDKFLAQKIQSLKDSDLLMTVDVKVWGADGLFCSTDGVTTMKGILRDSCIGEAPETFQFQAFEHILRPLRREFYDAMNQLHHRAPMLETSVSNPEYLDGVPEMSDPRDMRSLPNLGSTGLDPTDL